MNPSGTLNRFGTGILAGLALLILSTAAGCGSSAPELAAGEEEFAAVEPTEAPAVADLGESDLTEPLPDELSEEPIPDLPELTDLTELTELNPDVVIIPPEELLETASKGLVSLEKGPTKKISTSDLQESTAAALEALDRLLNGEDASTEERQQAWDLKLKLEFLAIQQNWPGYTERLADTRDRLWDTEFTREAEYANSLLMKTRLYGKDVPVWQAVEKLTEHAVAFPTGVTPVRMFLSYATELTKRRDYTNAKKVCEIALFNMKDHPQERQIEEYLAKLESPDARGVRITSRDKVAPIRRRKDSVQRLLEKEVKQMQPMLPLQLDPITRLDKVTAGWHTIKYSYTVTGATREVLKKRASIQKRVSSQLRTTFSTQMLLDDGVQFSYRYFDTKGSLLFRFSVSK